jgi:hypothetical protein
LGVSRIRRTATKRRSLALAASHAGTCETGVFKRPVRRGIRRRKKTKDWSHSSEQRTEQPGWTEVYAVPVSGSLMRALPKKGSEIEAGNNVSGRSVAKGLIMPLTGVG